MLPKSGVDAAPRRRAWALAIVSALACAAILFVYGGTGESPLTPQSVWTYEVPGATHNLHDWVAWYADCGLCATRRCSKDSTCATENGYVDPEGSQKDLCLCSCCKVQCGFPSQCAVDESVEWSLEGNAFYNHAPSESQSVALVDAFKHMTGMASAHITNWEQRFGAISIKVDVPRSQPGTDITSLVTESALQAQLHSGPGAGAHYVPGTLQIEDKVEFECASNDGCPYGYVCNEHKVCVLHKCRLDLHCQDYERYMTCRDHVCVHKYHSSGCSHNWQCYTPDTSLLGYCHDGACYLAGMTCTEESTQCDVPSTHGTRSDIYGSHFCHGGICQAHGRYYPPEHVVAIATGQAGTAGGAAGPSSPPPVVISTSASSSSASTCTANTQCSAADPDMTCVNGACTEKGDFFDPCDDDDDCVPPLDSSSVGGQADPYVCDGGVCM